jgi:hypothetical protein
VSKIGASLYQRGFEIVKTQVLVCLFVTILLVLPIGAQAGRVEEKPGAFVMVADLLVARPIGLMMLGIGSAAYVVTLPFSLFGGNPIDSSAELVFKPAREVFLRCLGCRTPGRKQRIKVPKRPRSR